MRFQLRTLSFCRGLAVFLALASLSLLAAAQDAPKDQVWPKVYENDGKRLVLYQPQVSKWENYDTIAFVMAVAASNKDAKTEDYGVLSATAKTVVNPEKRTVVMTDFKYDLRFPDADAARAAALDQQIRAALPTEDALVVSLDRILAAAGEDAIVQKSVEVNLDPPTIYYSKTPAILVIYVGPPSFKPIAGTNLMVAENTNWDVLLDGNTYYLLNGDQWLTAPDPVAGPWAAAKALPKDVAKLPDDPNWDSIRKNQSLNSKAVVPAVFVSQDPAELLVTDGTPKFAAIPSTDLMLVSNSDSMIYIYNVDEHFYLPLAGRWFRSVQLSGPWYAATLDLPAEFAKLPNDAKHGDILATVPGTVQARDAVLLASVPQKVEVKRSDVNVDLAYAGDPQFEIIEGTPVSFALNTASDVFLVDNVYYCCQQGVWFIGTGPSGPWLVCDAVPPAIYTIPPSHPKHNVTYVYVYDTSPDVVVVGYTSGYLGAYVCNGLLLFGAGYLYHDAVYHHGVWVNYPYLWNPCYYSYGCHAAYGWAYGGFYRGASCYGPWGGAGRGGYYNPATGGWARGSYCYGPAGEAHHAAAYNPYTGVYRSTSGGHSVYGSWKSGVVATDDRWVAGGKAEGWNGQVGWVKGSEGRGMLHYDTRWNSGTVIKGKDDGVFVGTDNNIYRRDSDGDWQKHEKGGWQSAGFTDKESSAHIQSKRADKPVTATKPSRPVTAQTPPPQKTPARQSAQTAQAPREIKATGATPAPQRAEAARTPAQTAQQPREIKARGNASETRSEARPTPATSQRATSVQRPATSTGARQQPQAPSQEVIGGLRQDANERARGNTNVLRQQRSATPTATGLGNGAGRSMGGGGGGALRSGGGGGGGMRNGGGGGRGGGGFHR